MHNRENTLGAKLKSIRSERGLSQRELAQLAGLSANAISLIERDENSPSVATLQNLATALNVKISFFFELEEDREILLVRNGKRPYITSRGVTIEGIGGKLSKQEIEPFLVKLEPQAESGSRQVVHTGHEFVFCINGQVEYVIDDDSFILEKGDILMFEAHLPHIWRNRTDKFAEFLLILQTPVESDEPVQRHFLNYPSLSHLE